MIEALARILFIFIRDCLYNSNFPIEKCVNKSPLIIKVNEHRKEKREKRKEKRKRKPIKKIRDCGILRRPPNHISKDIPNTSYPQNTQVYTFNKHY